MIRSKENGNAKIKTAGDGAAWNEHGRRIAIYAGAFLISFLSGLVAIWVAAREWAQERDRTQMELRVSRLQNELANLAVDARRGEYEPTRQSASEFYTNLRAKIERRDDSDFAVQQRESVGSLPDNRDDTFTLLARSDAASGERLAEVYDVFRQAAGNNLAAPAAP